MQLQASVGRRGKLRLTSEPRVRVHQQGTLHRPAQGDSQAARRGIDVAEEIDVAAPNDLVQVVEGVLAAREADVGHVRALRQGRSQRAGRGPGHKEGRPPALALEHAGHGLAHSLVIALQVGRPAGRLRGEDHGHARPPGLLHPLQVARRYGIHAGQDDDGELLAVHPVLHPKPAPLHQAAVIQHLGVQVGEVHAQRVRQQARHHRIVSARHGHAALIVPPGPVEVMPGILRLDGVDDGHVGHVPAGPGKHIVQPREETIEPRQLSIVQRVAPRQLGQEGHVPVIIPYGMRYEVVHALGVLLHGHLVHRLHRDVPHGPVGLRHHIVLVPAVGRGGHHLIEILGGAPAPNLVDARHRQVLARLHQVARHARGVGNLLLVLVPCGQNAVAGGPLADGAHEGPGIELGAQAEEPVARSRGDGADVVPQGRVEQLGRRAVGLFVALVEVVGPHPPLGTVHRRLVEEGGNHRPPESPGQAGEVGLVRIVDEKGDSFLREVVHVGVAVRDALEAHHRPLPLGHVPHKLPLALEHRPQVHHPVRPPVPGHQAHQPAPQFQPALQPGPALHAELGLVKPLHRIAGVVVHESRYPRSVDSPHAAAREAVLVIHRHVGSHPARRLHRPAVDLEVLRREVSRAEASAEGQDGTAPIAVGQHHLLQLPLHLVAPHGGVVPKP